MREDGTLPDEIVEVLLSVAAIKSYLPRQELFDSRSSPTAMYGVLEGEIRVSLVAVDGRQPVVAMLGAGQWFGEAPLLDRQARAFRAEAVTASKIACVPAYAFTELINTQPKVLLAITRLVCSRYRQALAWGEGLLLHSLPARLAGRLLTSGGTVVALSQQDLASQLGVSRATVNRQLSSWERQGLLRLGYRCVEILDSEALETARRSG